MKNLKKVLALVVVFTMMLSTVAFAAYPDVAEDADYATAVEVLSALNILKGDDQGNFNPDANITRAEFAAVVCRAIGMEKDANAAKGATAFSDVKADHWATGYINVANQMGIINGMGDGTFAPEENVTYEQAVKMLAVSLGYEYIAQSNGGWPTGYLVVANRYGLTKGVKASSGEPAARSIVAELTFNALECPLMEQGVWGTEEEWYVYDGFATNGMAQAEKKELLANRLEVVRLTGQVIATERAHLRGSNSEKGEILFDINTQANGGSQPTKLVGDAGFDTNRTSRRFFVGDTLAPEFFANQVDIYATEVSRNEWKLLAIVEEAGKNVKTEITTADVDASTGKTAAGGNAIWYYKEGAKYSTKLDLATTAAIVINNNASAYAEVGGTTTGTVDGYLQALDNLDATGALPTGTSKANVGKITLIDWDNNYNYDVILVGEYAHAIVDKVNVEAGIIRTKTNGLKSIDLKINDDTKVVSIKDKAGNKVALEDIQEGDVLAIIADTTPTSWVDTIEITVIPEAEATVTGTLTEDGRANAGNITALDKVYIDGEAYGLCTESTNGNRIVNYSKMGINSTGTFYLSIDGKIIGFEGEKAVDGNFAFILRAAASVDPMSAGKIQMKVLTNEGEIVTYTVGDRVTMNVLTDDANEDGHADMNGATPVISEVYKTFSVLPTGGDTFAITTNTNPPSTPHTYTNVFGTSTWSGLETQDAYTALSTTWSTPLPSNQAPSVALADRFVKLGVNASGVVTRIIIPDLDTNSDFESNNLTTNFVEYKAADARFGGSVFTDGAKVFVLDQGNNYEDSTVKTIEEAFVDEGEYKLIMYKDGATTYDAAIVIDGQAKFANTDGIAIVKNVSVTKTAENEDALIIRFMQDGEEKSVTLVDNKAKDLTNNTAGQFASVAVYGQTTGTKIKTGDVFTYTASADGIVESFAVIAYIGNGTTGFTPTAYASNAHLTGQPASTKDVKFYMGYINDMEGNVVAITGANGGLTGDVSVGADASEYYFKRYDAARYDLSTGAYQLGNVEEYDLAAGLTVPSYVLVKTVDDVVTDIFAIDPSSN